MRLGQDIGLNVIVNERRQDWRDHRVGWGWDVVRKHWQVRLGGIAVGMIRMEMSWHHF